MIQYMFIKVSSNEKSAYDFVLRISVIIESPIWHARFVVQFCHCFRKALCFYHCELKIETLIFGFLFYPVKKTLKICLK